MNTVETESSSGKMLFKTSRVETWVQSVSTVSVSGRMSNFNRSCVGIPVIKASRILRVRSPDLSTPPELAKAMFASLVRSVKKSSGVSFKVSNFLS